MIFNNYPGGNQLHMRLMHALLLMSKRTVRTPRSCRLVTLEEIRDIIRVKACGDPTKSVVLVSAATSSCGFKL
jgi:hypothetical protein